MRSIILIPLFVLLSAYSMQAQCSVAIATSSFNAIKFEVSRAINPASKLSILSTRSNSNCFYASQAKELAMLLDNDNDKLIFCQQLHPRIIDQTNEYVLYDVFNLYSSMFRLHDFIHDGTGSISTPILLPPPGTSPSYTYPEARFYTGSKGCDYPMSDVILQNIILTIQAQSADIAKYTTSKSLMTGKCMSIEQLMRITALIENESYRLDILKTFIARIYDRGNFNYAAQLLTIEPYKNDYINYCNTISGSTTPPPVSVPVDSFAFCKVTTDDFNSMQATIQNISFSSTKVSQIKTLMNTRCFTANQVKLLMNQLDYENDKLEIAKYGYAKCIDKNNYFSVNDAFSYSSSITQLNDYINQH
ncbi:MAG: DUF4476 domain-containing protein [Bacteroidota bacterium]